MTEAESNRRLAEALWKYLKPKIGKLTPGQSDETGGDSGKRIYQTREHYYLSLSSTELIGGAWQDTVPVRPAGTYIWHRWVIYYVDGTRDELNPVCVTGDPGDPGTSVSVEAIQYQQGNSATTPPADESGWSAQPVAVEQGYYLWTRTKFSDGSYAYCVSRQAQDGAHGVSVVNQTMEYYLSMETGELLPAPKSETWTGDWQPAVPTIVEDTYMWYRVRTYYSNGGSTVTDPVCMSSVMNEVVAPSYGELGSLIASAQRNMEVLEETLRAELVSQSVMGDFRSEMETKFSQSAEGLELQMQAYSQLKGNLDLLSEAFENYTAAMAGSIKVGVVYYENALPVMGVAVGQNLSTTVDEDGVVHIDQVNFRAIYAAKEMSFWQGDKKVAYISGQKLFINEANILAGATIGDWEITTSNGLAFKYVGG